MKDTSFSQLTRTLKKALLSAGAIIQKGFFQKRQVTFKSPTSPVTHIDLLAEKTIISIIRREFPRHMFLAEESDYQNNKNRPPQTARLAMTPSPNYRWIIDPLDGTVNFLHRIPQCCVSIGVERDGQIVAGGIFDPFREELFLAQRGKGASLNGKRIQVSDRKTLARSLLITGFPYDHRERASFYLKIARPFLQKSMDLRRFGSAALDLAWIACGRAEGYWEFNLNPWDVAAGWLIVEEAGGKVSDFRNRPFNVNQPQQVLATNGHIHGEMVKIFRKALR